MHAYVDPDVKRSELGRVKMNESMGLHVDTAAHFYIRQVNGVKLADVLFSSCLGCFAQKLNCGLFLLN